MITHQTSKTYINKHTYKTQIPTQISLQFESSIKLITKQTNPTQLYNDQTIVQKYNSIYIIVIIQFKTLLYLSIFMANNVYNSFTLVEINLGSQIFEFSFQIQKCLNLKIYEICITSVEINLCSQVLRYIFKLLEQKINFKNQTQRSNIFYQECVSYLLKVFLIDGIKSIFCQETTFSEIQRNQAESIKMQLLFIMKISKLLFTEFLNCLFIKFLGVLTKQFIGSNKIKLNQNQHLNHIIFKIGFIKQKHNFYHYLKTQIKIMFQFYRTNFKQIIIHTRTLLFQPPLPSGQEQILLNLTTFLHKKL
eukprot:TRINITY_DN3755_c1_g2_i1.p1 TRINITY_DN3755_c1_g2~~TRINITY_DN3755_c1_g2_i1.p1  ORF type:complete len:306 (+),score=-18.06 TRINITY_DN3755_c1_g2_i1:168-1085(+)